jgi:hypothetical protein
LGHHFQFARRVSVTVVAAMTMAPVVVAVVPVAMRESAGW